MAKRTKSRGESHVRLYQHELACPAYRTLSPDARSLLIELRALYRPAQGNVVYLSVREAMTRIGIGQRRTQAAFADLLERGWITVEQRGSFTQKIRHATSFRLENEATAAPGAEPTKTYMRWRPDTSAVAATATDRAGSRFSTVAVTATDGSCPGYRELPESAENRPDGSCPGYRDGDFSGSTVAVTATQIYLPREGAVAVAGDDREDDTEQEVQP